jgi:hypothetical protein
MISLSRTSMTAYFCAVIMLFSTQEVKPIKLASKALWTAAVVIGLHCYWKNIKPIEALKDESFIETIKNAKSIEEVQYIVQRWFLGHNGKPSGIKVAGSNLDVQGKRSALAPQITGDSQELVLYTYKGVEAYGLCGVTWSYVKMIYDALKAVKDFNEVTNYWDITSTSTEE